MFLPRKQHSGIFVPRRRGVHLDGAASESQQIQWFLSSLGQPSRGDFDLYLWLLRKCGSCKDLEAARQVHRYMQRDGYGGETLLSNMLVRMYGACDSIEDAREGFEATPSKNQFSYNIMVAAYARCGHLHEARLVFDKMPQQGEVAWTALLSGYAQNGYVDQAKAVFDDMPEKTLVPWNAMIAAYAQSEYCNERALALFKTMDLEGVQPDKITFISVVDACTGAAHFGLGQRVHVEAEQLGFMQDVSVATALVNMYGKSGSVDCARCVFESMHRRNVVSWTAMVAAYAHNGHLQQAKQLFDQSSSRNVVTWNTLLAAYAQNGQMVDAKDVFDRMPWRSLVSWNSMVGVNGLNGNVREARAVFEEVTNTLTPNVVSWNVIVGAYAQNGYGREAVELFKRMDLEGMQPNRLSFLGAIEGCSMLEDFSLCRTMHSLVNDFDFCSHLTIVTALVNMYAKASDPDAGILEAKNLFDSVSMHDEMLWNSMILAYSQAGRLEQARELFDEMPYKNLVSWNVMITAYVQANLVDEAKTLFDQTTDRDVVSWNIMMLGYIEIGRLDLAMGIFEQIEDKNVASWNTMMLGHTQLGNCRHAVDMFRRLDLEGVQANAFTFVCALEAYSHLASAWESRVLHSVLKSAGYDDTDTGLATGLVNMYGKCGNLEAAREVFDNMSDRTMVSWNSMLTAYSQNGCNQEVQELFREMQLNGKEPDTVTFITTLSACSHGGVVEKARDHFTSLVGDYGLEPNADHYTCMVDLLGRSGRTMVAEELVNSLPFTPDATALSTLLGACNVQGDVGVASRMAKKVYNMQDAGCYVLLSNTMKWNIE